MDTHGCTCFFHAAQDGNGSGQGVDCKTAYYDDHFCDHAEFFYVIDCFVFAAGTEALAYDGHQADAYTDGCDSV